MLNPPMRVLLKRVDNKYLLVNIASKRARDIAAQAEEDGEQLEEKPVKIALTELAQGKIICKQMNTNGKWQ